MGLFKRKQKFDSKFKKGDFVSFHYEKELKVGIINEVKLNGNEILYDIKVGGECPSLLKDIKEEKIFKN